MGIQLWEGAVLRGVYTKFSRSLQYIPVSTQVLGRIKFSKLRVCSRRTTVVYRQAENQPGAAAALGSSFPSEDYGDRFDGA